MRKLLLAATLGAFGCVVVVAGEIPPPRSDLRAVPLPEMASFEEDVRTQLTGIENQLRRAASQDGIDDQHLSDAFGTAGRVYHVYGLLDSAEACYLNASRLKPLNFSWAYLLARLYHSRRSTQQALTWYLRSGLIRADYTPLVLNLGLLQLETGQLDSAREAFESVVEKAPGNAAALAGLGRIALEVGENEVAILKLEEAIQRVPEATRIHDYLSRAYSALGQEEQAQRHREQSGPSEPPVADPVFDALLEARAGSRGHVSRGQHLYGAGEYEAAAAEFKKAAEANPGNVLPRLALASALAEGSDVKGAEDHYREVLRLDPGNRNALFGLGSLWSRQGEWNRAIPLFEETLQGGRDDPGVRFALALALQRVGRLEESLSQYEAVIRVNPGHTEAILAEASLLVRMRRFARALDRLEAAHRVAPQEGLIAHSLARLLAACPDTQLRDGERALDLARLVYKALPSVEHAETVALALGELNRCQEASEWQAAALRSAQETNQPELVERLSATLAHYQTGPHCRP